MNFPNATNEHLRLIGEEGRKEVAAGRRYLCTVATINNTTFQQSKRYEWLPAPDIALIKARAGETIMQIEPVLYFGHDLSY